MSNDIFYSGVQNDLAIRLLHFHQSVSSRPCPIIQPLRCARVVGWCDIIPMRGVDFSHCGLMGMGLHVDYRRQSIGTRLLNATIQAAKEYGLERVELEVYTSNIPAIRLYEKRGFVPEGVKMKARKLDGEYFDIQVMALFINP